MTTSLNRLPRLQEALPAADEPWLASIGRLEGAYSPAAIERTVGSFRFFQTWCALASRQAFPADGSTIAAFLDAYASVYAPRTMMNHLHALQRVHLAAGESSATSAEAVQVAMRRHMRLSKFPRRRFEVTAEVRDRLCAACPSGLIGLRDKALINLAFDTFCYRGELTILQVQDLRRLPDGTAELALRWSHHDTHAGPVFLSQRGFNAVTAWITAAGLESGAILRSVRNGRVGECTLKPSSLGVRLRTVAIMAGYPDHVARRITCHSFRVGAAQSLGASGRTLLQIMRAGRWSRPRAPARYLREAAVETWGGSDGDIYPVLPSVQLRRGIWRE